MQFADRLKPLQANVFADMDRAKAAALKSGQSIIDLSLGSSDLPTAPHVLEAIAEALPDTSTHGYSLFHSTHPFRQTAAAWYTQKFGVPVDPRNRGPTTHWLSGRHCSSAFSPTESRGFCPTHRSRLSLPCWGRSPSQWPDIYYAPAGGAWVSAPVC